MTMLQIKQLRLILSRALTLNQIKFINNNDNSVNRTIAIRSGSTLSVSTSDGSFSFCHYCQQTANRSSVSVNVVHRSGKFPLPLLWTSNISSSSRKMSLSRPRCAIKVGQWFRLPHYLNIQKASIHTEEIQQTVVCEATKDIDVDYLQDTIKEGSDSQSESSVLKREIQFNNAIDAQVEEKCKKALQSLNPRQEKMLNVIKLEYDHLLSQGNELLMKLEDVKSKTWLEALTISTMEERLSLYLNQQPASCQVNKYTPLITDDNLRRNNKKTIVSTEYLNTASISWKNHRLAQAMQHEVPLVIDLGFSQQMSMPLLNSTAQQVWDMYRTNRDSPNPYHLMLTSCAPDNPVYRYFQLFHAAGEQNVLMERREEQATELFNRTEMVYLSSRADSMLKSVDSNTVYILGAYSSEPRNVTFRCLQRSKEFNVPAMRLPIDKYVKWPKAPKNLALQDIMSILVAVRNGKTWTEAFDYIIRYGDTIPGWVKEVMRDPSAQWEEPKQHHQRRFKHFTKRQSKMNW